MYDTHTMENIEEINYTSKLMRVNHLPSHIFLNRLYRHDQ